MVCAPQMQLIYETPLKKIAKKKTNNREASQEKKMGGGEVVMCSQLSLRVLFFLFFCTMYKTKLYKHGECI